MLLNITFGLLIPAQAALIPLFSIYNNVGLANSRIGLILLYTAQSLPLSVMLFRNEPLFGWSGVYGTHYFGKFFKHAPG